jgi:hypothetical protein
MDGESVTESSWFLALRARFSYLLVRASRENLFVCVPQTCSLSMSAISLADVEHHIVGRDASGVRGDFTTLSGRRVHISGTRMSAGRGFAAPVDAAVLSSQTLSVALPDGVEGRLHVYFISRPLEGGNSAPGSVDQLSQKELSALRGFLRLSPEAEAPLADLAAAVRELADALSGPPTVGMVREWLRGGGGAGGAEEEEEDSGEIDAEADLSQSPLARELQALVSATATELLESGALAVATDASRVALFRKILFALVADASEALHAPVMSLLGFARRREVARVEASFSATASLPATALGLKKTFVCDLSAAADVLAGVTAARCPLEKLQVLVRANTSMQTLLEVDLGARGIDLSELDFGADDLLPLMASLLATAWRRGDGDAAAAAVRNLPVHLAYIHLLLHPDAANVQHSSHGYTLANFEQVLSMGPPGSPPLST